MTSKDIDKGINKDTKDTLGLGFVSVMAGSDVIDCHCDDCHGTDGCDSCDSCDECHSIGGD